MRTIKRLLLRSRFYRLIAVLAMGVSAQTAQQIAQGWAALSGNQGGKVVFGRTDQIWIMDLKTGLAEAVADFRLAYTQFGPSSSYKFSPDGTRILAQNDQVVVVVNADGSERQTIWQGAHPWDLIAACWDGDSAVVYSTYSRIAKTAVHTDNTPGSTTYLYSEPTTTGYTSVDKSGPYLCFINIAANAPTRGYHRPCIFNTATGAYYELVNRDEDGCTIRLRPDSSGVCILNKSNHIDPALIMDLNRTVLGTLPTVTNLGISGMRWSNKTDFIVHNGDRIIPGNTSHYAWIRKLSTKEYVFLGTNTYWPDLWIGSDAGAARVQLPRILPSDGSFKDSVTVEIVSMTEGADIYYTTNGVVPTQTSSRYTGSFVLRATTAVKAKAYKAGLAASNVAEKTFFKGIVRQPEDPAGILTGLDYSYYEGTWSALPNFSTLTPMSKGTVDSFNISRVMRRTEAFGIVFTGFISIVKDDYYTFYCLSDAGSKLFIGDSLIVNNDGVHTILERSGTIALASGRHAICVAYFETTGSEALTVSYSGGGIVKRPIPGSVLCRRAPDLTYTLHAPDGGETFELGDTMRLSWFFSNGTGRSSVLTLSRDDGATFPILLSNSPIPQNAELGSKSWVIPLDTSYLTGQGRVMVSMYNNPDINDISDAAFRIVKDRNSILSRRRTAAPAGVLRIGGRIVRFAAPGASDRQRIAVHTSDGREVFGCALEEVHRAGIFAPVPPGAYVVRVTGNGGATLFRTILTIPK